MIIVIPTVLMSCNTPKETSFEKIQKNKEIILGTSADYPPYEFPIIDKNGNEQIVGFDILIAEKIAENLNVKLKIKNLDFNGLLDALNSGSVDIIMSGITPSEERKKSIDFSNIYYTAKNVLLVLDKNINSIDDLNNLSVGVQVSSMQERIAIEKLTNSKIKSLIKVPDLILELTSKKVEAIIVELPIAEQYIRTNPELSIVQLNELNENLNLGSAVGIRKGETELLDKINSTINRLKNENQINEFFNRAISIFSKS